MKAVTFLVVSLMMSRLTFANTQACIRSTASQLHRELDQKYVAIEVTLDNVHPDDKEDIRRQLTELSGQKSQYL